MSAELAARRTAAAAVLADYQRSAVTADVADRAMWGARLADMLALILAALNIEDDAGPELARLAAIREVIAEYDAGDLGARAAMERSALIAFGGDL